MSEPARPPASRGSDALSRYWRKNLVIMSILLVVWAAVGLGAGVLFADSLNSVHLGGYPLGFWFAQQGSIIVFVLIILVYALLMNRLDREHHEDLVASGEPLPPDVSAAQNAEVDE